MTGQEWPLVRFIVPSFPEVNIFTRPARKTTALGPVMVATSASRLWGQRAEVIDENNYHRGPRENGLPDHKVLQQKNPAQVVGFYCGLTSTMERVWDLTRFYRQKGVFTIAGGRHVHHCPEEALNHGIDLVVHGESEIIIRQILVALRQKRPLEAIPGISYLKEGEVVTNSPNFLEIPNLDRLPYPDFGLLRYAKVKIYPIGRIRGCGMNCEFCSVRENPRWASGCHLFNVVKWLAETRRARHFFIVDDRLEGDLEGTFEFFDNVAREFGDSLRFSAQIRLEAAKNTEFLKTMKRAGVGAVFVGYESPIDEDLKAMRKGYSSAHMLEWTRILRSYFWVHGMFMVGYPLKKGGSRLPAKETVRRFRKFIKRAHLDTIQVLHPVPIVGSDLRQRLASEGRIFPLELVPWSRYDGSFACFRPDSMTLKEFQEAPMKIMSGFYNPWSIFRIPLRIFAFLIDYFLRGWRKWHRGWLRDVIRYGGHLLLRKWKRNQKNSGFLEGLTQYQKAE